MHTASLYYHCIAAGFGPVTAPTLMATVLVLMTALGLVARRRRG